MQGLGGQFSQKECPPPGKPPWARGQDSRCGHPRTRGKVPIFPQAGTGVFFQMGSLWDRNVQFILETETPPNGLNPALREFLVKGIPRTGFSSPPLPRPHELNLGQKTPREAERAQPVSTLAGVSSSQNGTGCLCACLGWGWGERGQPEVAAQKWGEAVPGDNELSPPLTQTPPPQSSFSTQPDALLGPQARPPPQPLEAPQ